MEAIDFKKLLREERKRAKLKKKKEQSLSSDEKKEEQQKSSLVNRSDNNNSSSNTEKYDFRYDWKHPDGFLGLRALKLESICENPRSISYSSTALEKEPLEKENEISSATHRPNDSESDIPAPTANPVASTSPETALLDWLRNLPSGDSGVGEWKVMSYGKRRVCMFGEGTDAPVLPSPLAEIAQELVARNVFPPSSCPAPNHVLLNEYQPGQGIFPHTDGPRYDHRTATLSLGSDVVIEFTKRLTSSEIGTTSTTMPMTTTTISVGNDVRNGTNNNPDDTPRPEESRRSSRGSPIQVLLESGSLLVFQGDAYLNYCHGIGMDVWNDTTTDHCLNAPSGKIVPRGLRYSLTFRHKKS